MLEIVGDFSEDLSGVTDGLTLTFSASSLPLKQRWRNNGLSADFLADYVTTFFPKDEKDPASLSRHHDLRSAVGYIANELLENAMKYGGEGAAAPTTIKLALLSDGILFSGTNSATMERGAAFLAFVRELASATDTADLYVRQMERAGEDGGSGLGLLTMINDYGAGLAWQFEGMDGGAWRITTQVKLDI